MSESRIYFIADVDRTNVKIGVSNDPIARLRALQIGSSVELEIIVEMPGDERYERALHDRFSAYAVRGEWFALNGDLRKFVELLPPYLTSKPVPKKRATFERADRIPLIRTAAFQTHWEKLRSIVIRWIHLVGIEQFAEAVGVKPMRIWAAIRGDKDRGFRGEWIHFLPAEGRLEYLEAQTGLIAAVDKEVHGR